MARTGSICTAVNSVIKNLLSKTVKKSHICHESIFWHFKNGLGKIGYHSLMQQRHPKPVSMNSFYSLILRVLINPFIFMGTAVKELLLQFIRDSNSYIHHFNTFRLTYRSTIKFEFYLCERVLYFRQIVLLQLYNDEWKYVRLAVNNSAFNNVQYAQE